MVAEANGGAACPATEICSYAVLSNAQDFNGLSISTAEMHRCVASSETCNTQVMGSVGKRA